MKVLLTGATGFVGQYVLQALQRSGTDVVALGRNAPAGIASKDFIQCDLLQTAEVGTRIAEVQATHLLHLAWYAEHGKFWNSPLNLRWVDATVRLAEAFCAAGGKHITVAGTCAEYDWNTPGTLAEDSSPLAPTSLYGVAKDATHRLLAAICQQHAVRLAWGRIFFPYGTGEPAQKLIPSLLEVFASLREPFAVNTSACRDFLHVQDVADAFVQLLDPRAAGAFNICCGRATPLSELIVEMAQLTGGDPKPLLDLSVARPGDPPVVVGTCLKLQALGWRQRIDLHTGLMQSLTARN